MIIVVYGASASAHFIARKLSKEDNVELVYHLGSNTQVETTEKYRPLYFKSSDEILEFFQSETIDLVIPTVTPIVLWKKLDEVLTARKIPKMSPTPKLGQLEWSKITGKRLIRDAGVPTPKNKIMRSKELLDNFLTIPRPFVLKYECDWRGGLQTVIITDENHQQEYDTLKQSGSRRFLKSMGEFKDQHFLVEEFVEGIREYSYHALSNETGWSFLGVARDYKKFNNGDSGFNTAGMGCYSPVDNIDPRVHTYCDKILSTLKNNGTPYIGVLYLGILVKTDGTPIVLEINVRPGDPEIHTILSIINDDQQLSELFLATASNKLIPKIQIDPTKFSVAVRIVNKDYEKIIEEGVWQETPDPIQPFLWPETNVMVSLNKNRLLHSSVVVATDKSIDAAKNTVYNFLEGKDMYNYTYRKDIGTLL